MNEKFKNAFNYFNFIWLGNGIYPLGILDKLWYDFFPVTQVENSVPKSADFLFTFTNNKNKNSQDGDLPIYDVEVSLLPLLQSRYTVSAFSSTRNPRKLSLNEILNRMNMSEAYPKTIIIGLCNDIRYCFPFVHPLLQPSPADVGMRIPSLLSVAFRLRRFRRRSPFSPHSARDVLRRPNCVDCPNLRKANDVAGTVIDNVISMTLKMF
uniref:Uncharacterized protein n=1 Tax=Glossina austeni TaxID=7395 RepID=A0A1A9UPY6_GLOAU